MRFVITAIVTIVIACILTLATNYAMAQAVELILTITLIPSQSLWVAPIFLAVQPFPYNSVWLAEIYVRLQSGNFQGIMLENNLACHDNSKPSITTSILIPGEATTFNAIIIMVYRAIGLLT
ncbi:MAG: hypothetical protein WCF23_20755 [Candidatus Nitrosopolaris sp.]